MQRTKSAWNKSKLVGPKRPFDPHDVETIRRVLKRNENFRDLAILETGISTMLRASDLLSLQVCDMAKDRHIETPDDIRDDMLIRMRKTSKPITVQIDQKAKVAIADLARSTDKFPQDYLFTAARDPHGAALTLQALGRIIKEWCSLCSLPSSLYGTHSLRRTKPAEIYRRTGNLRAVQLLLGHSSIAITQKYLGIETADALKIAQRVEI